MAMTHLSNRHSWNLFFLWLWLILGISYFPVPGSFPLRAQVDEKSALFQQGAPGPSHPATVSQPMALPEETATPSPGLLPTFLKLVLALTITIGLIVITVWGLKWIWERRGLSQWAEDGKTVRILASTFLSPRKAIYLVEVGKRILVVGVGGEEMTCLDVIREEEEVEALRGTTQQGFPKVFNRVMRNQQTADTEAEAKRILEESSQAMGGYVSQLKNMKKKNTSESTEGK